jgi:hypothetical protein
MLGYGGKYPAAMGDRGICLFTFLKQFSLCLCTFLKQFSLWLKIISLQPKWPSRPHVLLFHMSLPLGVNLASRGELGLQG